MVGTCCNDVTVDPGPTEDVIVRSMVVGTAVVSVVVIRRSVVTGEATVWTEVRVVLWTLVTGTD